MTMHTARDSCPVPSSSSTGVQPLSAEIVGTYQDDFYAGTPAVTRNTFGAGHGCVSALASTTSEWHGSFGRCSAPTISSGRAQTWTASR